MVESITTKKFAKVGMCRWFQFIRESSRLITEWSLRFTLLSYTLIMQGGGGGQDHPALRRGGKGGGRGVQGQGSE